MKRTRRNGPGVPALTPAEALGMLASAITYLQQSGLRVRAGNDPQLGLVLAIDRARLTQDAFGVMGFEPIPRAAASTSPSESGKVASNASTSPAEPASTG